MPEATDRIPSLPDLRTAGPGSIARDDRDARRVVEAGSGPPLPLRPLPEPPTGRREWLARRRRRQPPPTAR